MADLTGSPFSQAVVPTPMQSDLASVSGGVDQTVIPGTGLVGSPFDKAIVPARTDQSETPNSLSGLPLRVDQVQVDGAPGRGTTVTQPSLMEPRKVAD